MILHIVNNDSGTGMESFQFAVGESMGREDMVAAIDCVLPSVGG